MPDSVRQAMQRQTGSGREAETTDWEQNKNMMWEIMMKDEISSSRELGNLFSTEPYKEGGYDAEVARRTAVREGVGSGDIPSSMADYFRANMYGGDYSGISRAVFNDPELREKYPDILPDEEIRKLTRAEVKERQDRAQDIFSRADPSGRRAQFFTAGAASLTNLAYAPLVFTGVGAGVRGLALAKSLLTIGVAEAGVEALNQWELWNHQKEIGIDNDMGNVVTNIAAAMTLGVVGELGGLAVNRAIRNRKITKGFAAQDSDLPVSVTRGILRGVSLHPNLQTSSLGKQAAADMVRLEETLVGLPQEMSTREAMEQLRATELSKEALEPKKKTDYDPEKTEEEVTYQAEANKIAMGDSEVMIDGSRTTPAKLEAEVNESKSSAQKALEECNARGL